MLELNNISTKSGKFILKDICLHFKKNQTHIIIGPTGSGKTMLLDSVIGFRKPFNGEVILNGKNINNLEIEKREIAYVPQSLCLFPHLIVEDNILYSLKVRNIEKKCDLIYELCESLGIKNILKRNIKNLSGGESQRVAVARAIASGYNILLLDEPFSALHEGMKMELWFLLKKLQQKYNLTIIMVTHNLEEAFFLGDTISVIINGEIMQSGEKEYIYYSPQSTEIAKFMGIRNLFAVNITDINKDKITVFCNELNASLNISPLLYSGSFKKGDTVNAGIRSDDIMILREGYLKPDQDNLLKGRILDIFEKGSSYLIIFSPENFEKIIEIELPNYAFQKLQLSIGQLITVSLKNERIFLLKG